METITGDIVGTKDDKGGVLENEHIGNKPKQDSELDPRTGRSFPRQGGVAGVSNPQGRLALKVSAPSARDYVTGSADFRGHHRRFVEAR